MYVYELADAIRYRGVIVEEYSGWTSRGSSSFNPRGAVCHWTAGPCNSTGRPSLHTCVNGRDDLDGPLCNVYLDRYGIAVIVAAGTANHAGKGGWRGLSGNSSVFGTEAECCNAGDWTDDQRWAYPRVCAAYCDLGGFTEEMICGHNEWRPGDKIDIYDWDMDRMRREVYDLFRGQEPEDDMPNKYIVRNPSEGVWLVDGFDMWRRQINQDIANIHAAAGIAVIDVDASWFTNYAPVAIESKANAPYLVRHPTQGYWLVDGSDMTRRRCDSARADTYIYFGMTCYDIDDSWFEGSPPVIIEDPAGVKGLAKETKR